MRPESEQSTIDIAEIEKSFPVPPKSRHGDRKTLPPLPSLAEIEKAATETVTSEDSTIPTETASKDRTPASGGLEKKELPLPFGIVITRPPRPISKDTEPRPTTGSTFTSIDPKRNLKYGSGKHAMVELSPQPSEDTDDPLNWPLWKKNLSFAALLSMVAVVGAMKTALVSLHSVLAEEYDVSYTAAVALTAVPLMISALTGMASTIVAKVWGKRPVYLVSTILVFIGSAWNIDTGGEYAQTMVARIFQGLGWGAFDALMLGSILDTFFEHERQTKIVIYNTVSAATTWGAPLIGGVASFGPRGLATQFEIFTSFLVVLMPFIILGAPETTYIRSSFEEKDTFPLLTRSQSRLPRITFSRDAVVQYLQNVKIWSYKAIIIDRALLMQSPKAAIAPSTMLLLFITLLPYVNLWSLTCSLSLLLAPEPFQLTGPTIGLLFLAPFVLGTAVVLGLPFLLEQKRFTRAIHLVTLAVGASFASIGIISFGLYMVGSAQVPGSNHISFPVISFLLGLLALGSATLDGTIRPIVQQSTGFTSANLAVALRNIADMQAGLTCLRNLVAGAFILGMPTVVRSWDGLRASAIGMGVAQMFVTAVVAAVYFELGEGVRRLDGRVMGLVDLSGLKQRGSFFDED